MNINAWWLLCHKCVVIFLSITANKLNCKLEGKCDVIQTICDVIVNASKLCLVHFFFSFTEVILAKTSVDRKYFLI